jgi:hypothetical protein
MWALRPERSCRLPGDALLASPLSSRTHAITIERSPRAVWPWLVQMGAGRAGWYSYDFIDNGGQPSADRIIRELQHAQVGDLFPALPGFREGFTVLRVDPERVLVLGWLHPGQRRPVMTWAFALKEPKPETTRLIVRARASEGSRPSIGGSDWTIRTFTAWGHLLMQQKQLLGIARRAEALLSSPAQS